MKLIVNRFDSSKSKPTSKIVIKEKKSLPFNRHKSKLQKVNTYSYSPSGSSPSIKSSLSKSTVHSKRSRKSKKSRRSYKSTSSNRRSERSSRNERNRLVDGQKRENRDSSFDLLGKKGENKELRSYLRNEKMETGLNIMVRGKNKKVQIKKAE